MEQNHQVGKGSASRSARRDVDARRGRARRPGLESLESRELLTVNEYSLLPAENNNTNSEPLAIVSGPDGNLWFTDLGTSEIGKITPAGQITMYTSGLTPNSSPEGITTGPDGNLWFVETGADKIGRIDPSTGVITEFSKGLSSGA
jgi:streptogramin lyase